jgi:hypothetical protein
LAAPAAIETVGKMVRDARVQRSEKEWKNFPTLGVMGRWTIVKGRNDEMLCFDLDDTDANLFKLRPVGENLYIADVNKAKQRCEEGR